MNQEKTNKTWIKLLIPFTIGVIVLISSILIHRLGNLRPTPQVIFFFIGVFGLILSIFSGIKIIQFKKQLKTFK
jgi:hypothetical protein